MRTVSTLENISRFYRNVVAITSEHPTMPYDDKRSTWLAHPDKDYSPARLDGLIDLAAHVLRQALQDLASEDLVIALDALAWWIDPEGAELYLQALGMDLECDDILTIFGTIDPNSFRNSARKHGRSDTAPAADIPRAAAGRATIAHRRPGRSSKAAGASSAGRRTG
jgi:hypothetical protein